MKKSKSNTTAFGKMMAGTVLAAGGWIAAKALRKRFTNYEVQGKVVLITGGSRGLGLVMARQLAEQGARIAICGRTDKSLQAASRDLNRRNHDHLAIPCDLSDPSQISDMIDKVQAEMGSIDILINNAGIIQVGPLEAMTTRDYEQAMKIHFWGPFHTMNQVVPSMMKREEGRIVNIVSIGGKLSFPHLLPYNTSKYALSGLSEGLTPELNKYNIKVTTVYPGLMRTGSPGNIDVKGQHKKEYAWFKVIDSLPLISVDVERAAGQIIEALKQGSKTVTLTVPAKLAIAAHGVAPNVTVSLLNLVNRLLPGKRGGLTRRKGYESEGRVSSSFLTRKTDVAAEKTLQMER